jgi:mono/diheme cytochrome c family protein
LHCSKDKGLFGKSYTPPATRPTEAGPRSIAPLVVLLLLCGLSLCVLTGCHSTPPPTPLAQLNPQQTRGHDVFQARCAVCHFERQTGALHGPSLLGVFKKPSLPSGAAATDERVTATIVHGRNNMPAMGNTLDQGDLDDLLAYLHTL